MAVFLSFEEAAMKKHWILVSALLAASGASQAHQIWLEQPAGETAVIRFGEFGDNLRETSPGLLDKFGKPVATLVSAQGEKAADGRKTGTGFALPFKAGQGDSIVAEDAGYPLYTSKKGEQELRNWYHPAARLITGFAAQAPRGTGCRRCNQSCSIPPHMDSSPPSSVMQAYSQTDYLTATRRLVYCCCWRYSIWIVDQSSPNVARSTMPRSAGS